MMPLSLKDLEGTPVPHGDALSAPQSADALPAVLRGTPGLATPFDGSEDEETLKMLAQHEDRATRRRAASRLAGGRGNEC